MNMGQASGGLDFGVKEYREVLVFKDKATRKFIDKGWEFGDGGTATQRPKARALEGGGHRGVEFARSRCTR